MKSQNWDVNLKGIYLTRAVLKKKICGGLVLFWFFCRHFLRSKTTLCVAIFLELFLWDLWAYFSTSAVRMTNLCDAISFTFPEMKGMDYRIHVHVYYLLLFAECVCCEVDVISSQLSSVFLFKEVGFVLTGYVCESLFICMCACMRLFKLVLSAGPSAVTKEILFSNKKSLLFIISIIYGHCRQGNAEVPYTYCLMLECYSVHHLIPNAMCFIIEVWRPRLLKLAEYCLCAFLVLWGMPEVFCFCLAWRIYFCPLYGSENIALLLIFICLPCREQAH